MRLQEGDLASRAGDAGGEADDETRRRRVRDLHRALAHGLDAVGVAHPRRDCVGLTRRRLVRKAMVGAEHVTLGGRHPIGGRQQGLRPVAPDEGEIVAVARVGVGEDDRRGDETALARRRRRQEEMRDDRRRVDHVDREGAVIGRRRRVVADQQLHRRARRRDGRSLQELLHTGIVIGCRAGLLRVRRLRDEGQHRRRTPVPGFPHRHIGGILGVHGDHVDRDDDAAALRDRGHGGVAARIGRRAAVEAHGGDHRSGQGHLDPRVGARRLRTRRGIGDDGGDFERSHRVRRHQRGEAIFVVAPRDTSHGRVGDLHAARPDLHLEGSVGAGIAEETRHFEGMPGVLGRQRRLQRHDDRRHVGDRHLDGARRRMDLVGVHRLVRIIDDLAVPGRDHHVVSAVVREGVREGEVARPTGEIHRLHPTVGPVDLQRDRIVGRIGERAGDGHRVTLVDPGGVDRHVGEARRRIGDGDRREPLFDRDALAVEADDRDRMGAALRIDVRGGERLRSFHDLVGAVAPLDRPLGDLVARIDGGQREGDGCALRGRLRRRVHGDRRRHVGDVDDPIGRRRQATGIRHLGDHRQTARPSLEVGGNGDRHRPVHGGGVGRRRGVPVSVVVEVEAPGQARPIVARGVRDLPEGEARRRTAFRATGDGEGADARRGVLEGDRRAARDRRGGVTGAVDHVDRKGMTTVLVAPRGGDRVPRDRRPGPGDAVERDTVELPHVAGGQPLGDDGRGQRIARAGADGDQTHHVGHAGVARPRVDRDALRRGRGRRVAGMIGVEDRDGDVDRHRHGEVVEGRHGPGAIDALRRSVAPIDHPARRRVGRRRVGRGEGDLGELAEIDTRRRGDQRDGRRGVGDRHFRSDRGLQPVPVCRLRRDHIGAVVADAGRLQLVSGERQRRHAADEGRYRVVEAVVAVEIEGHLGSERPVAVAGVVAHRERQGLLALDDRRHGVEDENRRLVGDDPGRRRREGVDTGIGDGSERLGAGTGRVETPGRQGRRGTGRRRRARSAVRRRQDTAARAGIRHRRIGLFARIVGIAARRAATGPTTGRAAGGRAEEVSIGVVVAERPGARIDVEFVARRARRAVDRHRRRRADRGGRHLEAIDRFRDALRAAGGRYRVGRHRGAVAADRADVEEVIALAADERRRGVVAEAEHSQRICILAAVEGDRGAGARGHDLQRVAAHPGRRRDLRVGSGRLDAHRVVAVAALDLDPRRGGRRPHGDDVVAGARPHDGQRRRRTRRDRDVVVPGTGVDGQGLHVGADRRDVFHRVGAGAAGERHALYAGEADRHDALLRVRLQIDGEARDAAAMLALRRARHPHRQHLAGLPAEDHLARTGETAHRAVAQDVERALGDRAGRRVAREHRHEAVARQRQQIGATRRHREIDDPFGPLCPVDALAHRLNDRVRRGVDHVEAVLRRAIGEMGDGRLDGRRDLDRLRRMEDRSPERAELRRVDGEVRMAAGHLHHQRIADDREAGRLVERGDAVVAVAEGLPLGAVAVKGDDCAGAPLQSIEGRLVGAGVDRHHLIEAGDRLRMRDLLRRQTSHRELAVGQCDRTAVAVVDRDELVPDRRGEFDAQIGVVVNQRDPDRARRQFAVDRRRRERAADLELVDEGAAARLRGEPQIDVLQRHAVGGPGGGHVDHRDHVVFATGVLIGLIERRRQAEGARQRLHVVEAHHRHETVGDLLHSDRARVVVERVPFREGAARRARENSGRRRAVDETGDVGGLDRVGRGLPRQIPGQPGLEHGIVAHRQILAAVGRGEGRLLDVRRRTVVRGVVVDEELATLPGIARGGRIRHRARAGSRREAVLTAGAARAAGYIDRHTGHAHVGGRQHEHAARAARTTRTAATTTAGAARAGRAAAAAAAARSAVLVAGVAHRIARRADRPRRLRGEPGLRGRSRATGGTVAARRQELTAGPGPDRSGRPDPHRARAAARAATRAAAATRRTVAAVCAGGAAAAVGAVGAGVLAAAAAATTAAAAGRTSRTAATTRAAATAAATAAGREDDVVTDGRELAGAARRSVGAVGAVVAGLTGLTLIDGLIGRRADARIGVVGGGTTRGSGAAGAARDGFATLPADIGAGDVIVGPSAGPAVGAATAGAHGAGPAGLTCVAGPADPARLSVPIVVAPLVGTETAGATRAAVAALAAGAAGAAHAAGTAGRAATTAGRATRGAGRIAAAGVEGHVVADLDVAHHVDDQLVAAAHHDLRAVGDLQIGGDRERRRGRGLVPGDVGAEVEIAGIDALRVGIDDDRLRLLRPEVDARRPDRLRPIEGRRRGREIESELLVRDDAADTHVTIGRDHHIGDDREVAAEGQNAVTGDIDRLGDGHAADRLAGDGDLPRRGAVGEPDEHLLQREGIRRRAVGMRHRHGILARRNEVGIPSLLDRQPEGGESEAILGIGVPLLRLRHPIFRFRHQNPGAVVEGDARRLHRDAVEVVARIALPEDRRIGRGQDHVAGERHGVVAAVVRRDRQRVGTGLRSDHGEAAMARIGQDLEHRPVRRRQ